MISILLAASRSNPPPGWEEGLLFDIWRNLIQADRYKMLLDGLSVTMQVTLGAAVVGVTLGFFAALLKMSKLAPLRAAATAYITVIRGTPMVLQLMIMWFVVFGTSGVPRVTVGIIAFGINSGAYVCEIFRAGILSVDHGQTEAGRSVGLNSLQTMRLIILPQAFKNALPPLCNEFISLFKETAVLGYIGTMDLTMAGSVIRSRTFSAFVPLITVALIYLSIVMLMTWLLGSLERRLRKSDSR